MASDANTTATATEAEAPAPTEMAAPTTGRPESLDDAGLIRLYEANKVPRTALTDACRREIERRAGLVGSVNDPAGGVSYVYDDTEGSVRRQACISAEFIKARADELKNIRRREARLGANVFRARGQSGCGRRVFRSGKTLS